MFVDILLYLAYGLIIICAAAAIILPLIHAVSDPGALVKSGIGVGALLVVFLISWAISGNEVFPSYTLHGVDSSLSKFVGGTLVMMYLLAAIAIIGIVYTEISKMIK
ncbi:MAG: hypothetical protein O2951_08685 [Bacteroidetes bacterium]|nr:hypothetical protein [Bacteroidota bacterium]